MVLYQEGIGSTNQKLTRKLNAGGVVIGGNLPIFIQSMSNVPAADVDGNVRQARELETAGCEILRVMIPSQQSVRLIPAIKAATTIPLVADVHFDCRLVLESVETGIDKVRINPSNIGSDDHVKAATDVCRSHGTPIRVGVNSGSLGKGILTKYGGPTAEALCENALHHVFLLGKYDFNDIVLSMKPSRVDTVIEAYELVSQACDYPPHLGVTEAGTERMGLIKSAIGIGSLLQRGVDDTIWVSLTADPVREIVTAMDTLRALNLRSGVQMISCPTCRRTNIDLIAIVGEVERRLDSCKKPIIVVVMGCAVNGPGEAYEADIGIVGRNGVGLIFKRGEIVYRVPEDRLVDSLMEEIESLQCSGHFVREKDVGMRTFAGIFGTYLNPPGTTYPERTALPLWIDEQNRELAIETTFPVLMERPVLFTLKEQPREALNVRRVTVQPCYAKELFQAEYFPELAQELRRRDVNLNGSLRGTAVRLEGDTLIITLLRGERDVLLSRGSDKAASRPIQEEFGLALKVSFNGTAETQADDARFIERVKQEQEIEYRQATEEKMAHYDAVINEDGSKKVKKNPHSVSVRGGDALLPTVLLDTVRLLYGRMDRSIKPVSTGRVGSDPGMVTIWGEIFSMDERRARDESKKTYSINITDYTGSVTLKPIEENSQCHVIDILKKGSAILVSGEISYDKYDHEIVLRPRGISTVELLKVADDAPEKRVELHLYTSMSSMGGITPIGDLIKRIAKWGHKATAITDHGVAQTHPDAMNAAAAVRKKGADFRAIYGAESYFVNDMVPALMGETENTLDDEFIPSDVETTGLSAGQDRITETGAVRIENGEIADSLDIFVNPSVHIPVKITKLTGITGEVVRDAPPEEETLQQFYEFCGEKPVLLAHNAAFDISFMHAAAERYGMDFPYPYIDTLPTCRSMLKGIKNYKLDTVARYLKLDPFNHHRVCDDAAALAKIPQNLPQRLKEDTDATRVKDINTCLAGGNLKRIRLMRQIILVENRTSLKNLYKLISYSHLDYFYQKPRIPKSVLVKYREGLLLDSACEAGELYRAMVGNQPWSVLKEIAGFYDHLEIQPIDNNLFMVRNGQVLNEETLREYNHTIVRLGEELDKPVAITCDVHFPDSKDDDYRKILMTGQGSANADAQASLYLRTTSEMLEEFAYFGKEKAYEVVVTNTNKIADMIDEISPIPSGVFPPFIGGAEKELNCISWERVKEIYGDPLPQIVHDRLKHESDSISKHGSPVLYMTVQKFVTDSEAHGYLVGPRGSVGSSFVANISGISEINPLTPHYICPNCKHSEFITDGSYGSGFNPSPKQCPVCGIEYDCDGHTIPFEAFLGFDGDKTPDIDLNFSGKYQSDVHRCTETPFGKDNVFKADTIATITGKTAIGSARKYVEEQGMVFYRAKELRPVIGCTGVKRTIGQHPGGIVVVPHGMGIYDFCPVQHPASDQKSDNITMYFDFRAIHDTICKLDELGHDVPTIYRYLEDYTGIPVMKAFMSDSKVMSLFISIETLGVTPEDIDSPTGTFSLLEVGTGFVCQMLMDAQPKTFSDLPQVSGLSHGTDVWLGNAQDLIKNKTCTISEVIGTRDSIMTYLLPKGLEPEMASKAMETARKSKASQLLTQEHIQATEDYNVLPWYINSCMKIKYMFPKTHATAYMISTPCLGWHKVHRSAEYCAAYPMVCGEDFDGVVVLQGREAVCCKMNEITMKGKEASKKEENALATSQIVNEMLARGTEVLPTDLHQSNARKYPVEDGKIRLPFALLSGVGEAAVSSLAVTRENDGPYISIDDLQTCSKVSKSVIEALQVVGAPNGLSESSQMSLF